MRGEESMWDYKHNTYCFMLLVSSLHPSMPHIYMHLPDPFFCSILPTIVNKQSRVTLTLTTKL